mgnify:CR=1 FL=1
MKIFIEGYGTVAVSILRKIQEIYEINSNCLMVNTIDNSSNCILVEYCLQNNISLSYSSYLNDDFICQIINFSPDLVISLYGRRIIPLRVLETSRIGSFNLHPSLLPDYKGCFSCPWAIIKGEAWTGITIHEMNETVDTGDILYQKSIEISPFETGYSLYHKCVSEFICVFDDFFSDYLWICLDN